MKLHIICNSVPRKRRQGLYTLHAGIWSRKSAVLFPQSDLRKKGSSFWMLATLFTRVRGNSLQEPSWVVRSWVRVHVHVHTLHTTHHTNVDNVHHRRCDRSYPGSRPSLHQTWRLARQNKNAGRLDQTRTRRPRRNAVGGGMLTAGAGAVQIKRFGWRDPDGTGSWQITTRTFTVTKSNEISS